MHAGSFAQDFGPIGLARGTWCASRAGASSADAYEVADPSKGPFRRSS